MRGHYTFECIVIALLFAVCGIAAAATVTQDINYQGVLTDPSGNPLSGTYSMTFRLYNVTSGGTVLATNTNASVVCMNGTFTTPVAFDSGFFDGRALWVGVAVGADAEMTPRQEIRPEPYALSLRPGALIRGLTASSTGLRVLTDASTSTGIYAETNGTNSPAVRAHTYSDTSNAVWGSTSGNGPAAVVGITSGNNSPGMYAVTSGTGSSGVVAGTTGIGSPAVTAGTTGNDSDGVVSIASGYYSTGIASAVTGPDSWGIYTTAYNTSSYAVYAKTFGVSSPGVYSRTYNDYSPAVVAVADQANGVEVTTSANNTRGVFVNTSGDGGQGVEVTTHRNNAHGVISSTAGVQSQGIWGYTSGNNSIAVYGFSKNYTGVMGSTERGDNNYGVYTPDNLYVGGKIDVAGTVDPIIVEGFRADPAVHYEAGDVVCLADSGAVVPCTKADDTNVIGVVGPSVEIKDGEVTVVIMGYRSARPDTGYVSLLKAELATAEASRSSPGLKGGESEITALKNRISEAEQVTRQVIRVKADASYGAIRMGALLTTSPTPGHAMKAINPQIGSILGKAMGTLESGTGTIEVLVLLQ